MKALMFCFSNTGNTKLVSEYLCRRLRKHGCDIGLLDITLSRAVPDIEEFDLIGFSFPIWSWGPPSLVMELVKSLPGQEGKPAFFFSTHGGIQGGTDYIFSEALRERGFRVVGVHDVQATTNEPVARRLFPFFTLITDRYPGRRQKKRIDSFADELAEQCRMIDKGMDPEEVRVINNFYNPLSLIGRAANREKFPRIAGVPSSVYGDLCDLCGECVEVSPVGCVTIESGEVRFGENCVACYSCYNHCPNNAISGKWTKGHQYKGPSKRVKEVFKG